MSNDSGERAKARKRLLARSNALITIGRSVVPHHCTGEIGNERCEAHHFIN